MKVWQFCIFKFKNKFYWVIGHMKKRLSLICQLVNRVCWDHELAKNSLWADRVINRYVWIRSASQSLSTAYRYFLGLWVVETGIHKIPLFHASDLHFYLSTSTNTKARLWILKSTKQEKCWSDAFIIEKNIKYNRVRGYFLKPLYTFYTLTIQREMTVKYGLH